MTVLPPGVVRSAKRASSPHYPFATLLRFNPFLTHGQATDSGVVAVRRTTRVSIEGIGPQPPPEGRKRLPFHPLGGELSLQPIQPLRAVGPASRAGPSRCRSARGTYPRHSLLVGPASRAGPRCRSARGTYRWPYRTPTGTKPSVPKPLFRLWNDSAVVAPSSVMPRMRSIGEKIFARLLSIVMSGSAMMYTRSPGNNW